VRRLSLSQPLGESDVLQLVQWRSKRWRLIDRFAGSCAPSSWLVKSKPMPRPLDAGARTGCALRLRITAGSDMGALLLGAAGTFGGGAGIDRAIGLAGAGADSAALDETTDWTRVQMAGISSADDVGLADAVATSDGRILCASASSALIGRDGSTGGKPSIGRAVA